MIHDRLASPGQREYVRAHPVVLWLCIGVAIVGALAILVPSTASVTYEVLPEWVRLLFNGFWAAGGAISAVGILTGRRELEAGGLALLATAFVAWFVIIVTLDVSRFGSAAFILTLAVGCGLRAKFLAGF